MLQRIKAAFSGASPEQKVLLLANLALMLSVFLPWYSDLDTRNIASRFTGVNGPLYVVGLFLFVTAALSFVFDFIVLLGHGGEYEKMPQWQIAAGTQSVFLVALAYSVYAHDKFGLGYLSSKSFHFGFYLALAGGFAVVVASALKLYRKNTVTVITHREENELANDKTESAEDGAEESAEEIEDLEALSSWPRENVAEGRPPLYKVERTQSGIETRVRTVTENSHENNQI